MTIFLIHGIGGFLAMVLSRLYLKDTNDYTVDSIVVAFWLSIFFGPLYFFVVGMDLRDRMRSGVYGRLQSQKKLILPRKNDFTSS